MMMMTMMIFYLSWKMLQINFPLFTLLHKSLKSDLYLCYRIEDLITPQYCSDLILLTNQIMMRLKVF